MLTCGLDNQTNLRLLTPGDAEELFALIDANRAHLRPWFEMVDLTRSVSDTTAWLERMAARAAESPRGWSGIFYNGELVGAIGVSELEEKNRSCEIGYYLAADACGRGLASRAVVALADHLLRELNFHRVALRVAATNARSINLIRKIGFVQEGLLRDADFFDGKARDLLLFAILQRDWRPQRS